MEQKGLNERSSPLGTEIDNLKPKIDDFKSNLTSRWGYHYALFARENGSELPENMVTVACQDVVEQQLADRDGIHLAYRIGVDFHLSPTNMADASRRAIERWIGRDGLKVDQFRFVNHLAEIDNLVLPLSQELSGRSLYDTLQTAATEMIDGRDMVSGLALRGVLTERPNRMGKFPDPDPGYNSFDGANFLDCVLAGAAVDKNWEKYTQAIIRETASTVSRNVENINSMHTCTTTQLRETFDTNGVPRELMIRGVSDGIGQLIRTYFRSDGNRDFYEGYRANKIMEDMGFTEQEKASTLAKALAESATNFYIHQADRYQPNLAYSLLGQTFDWQTLEHYKDLTFKLSRMVPEDKGSRDHFLYEAQRLILEKLTSPAYSSQKEYHGLALEVYAENQYLFGGKARVKDLLANHADLSNLYYAAIVLASSSDIRALAKWGLVENVAPNHQEAEKLLKLIAANDHDEARSLFNSFLTPTEIAA